MDLSRSTLKLFLSKTGNALLFFVGITLFARWLPPDQLGIYFLYLALLGVLSIFSDLGIQGALEKRLSEGMDPGETLGSAAAFKLVTLALVSLAVLATGRYTDAYLGANLSWYVVLGLVTREAAEFYVAAVRGELRVGETAPIQLSRRVVWVTLGGALVTFGYGVFGLVIAQICGRLVEFGWASWRCDTGIGRPSADRVRSLVSFSKYETITAVGGRIYQWMDVLVIGFFLLPEYVSAYEVAWQVTLLVLLASKSLELVLFPQLSRWDAESSLARIGSTVTRALEFALFVSVPAVVGAVLYSRDILHFVFGPEYTIAAAVLVVLMVEKFFQSFNDVVGASVRAIDRPDLAAKATTAAVGLNLLLSPLLVVTVGFVGAAVATTVSWMVNAFLNGRYLSRYVDFEVPVRLLGWYAVSALVMGGVLIQVGPAVPVDGLLDLAVHVALGVVTYLGVSVLIPDVRDRIVAPGLRVLL